MVFSNLSSTKSNILIFDIDDIDLSIVNALRRIILSEVPTVALEFDPLTDKNADITIHINNSALHNEYLAHRLSLIPLCFPKDTIDNFDKSNYVFKLQKKNTADDILPVTTKDIKIYDKHGQLYPQEFHNQIFPACKITKEHILITKLRPNLYDPSKGEELDIEFKASKNIGQIHARWSPVCCCTFFNRLDNKSGDEALDAKIASVESEKGSLTPSQKEKIKGQFDALERFRYFIKNKYDEPCAFSFKIESECGLVPNDIFSISLDILYNKIVDFTENLATGKGVTINKIHENQHFYEVIIENEQYTLLNVLQSCVYNNEFRTKKDTTLEYIGYYQPHPLDPKMVLKIKFSKPTDVIAILTENTKTICDNINQIKAEWNAVVASFKQ